MNYVLVTHAAQCLGVNVGQLNLPRSGDGVDADALWRSPRYAEVVREREAIKRQLAAHRYDILDAPERRSPEEELKLQLRRESCRARKSEAEAV